MAVRPEAITVMTEDGRDAAPNHVPARVAQIVYRGGTTHIYVTLQDGTELVVFQQNRSGERPPAELRPGCLVVARWEAEGNHVLAVS